MHRPPPSTARPRLSALASGALSSSRSRLALSIAGIARRLAFGLQGDITSGLLNDLGIDGSPLGFHGGNRKRPFSAASRATRFWMITRRYCSQHPAHSDRPRPKPAASSRRARNPSSEIVIRGSVMRRACSHGPRDLRRVYGIGSMLTGPAGRRRAIVRAASASVGNGSASFFSPQATVGNLRVSQTECPPGYETRITNTANLPA